MTADYYASQMKIYSHFVENDDPSQEGAGHPRFLVQQNSLRDAILAFLNLNIFARHADCVRMANIAQMIHVLQAMVFTHREKMDGCKLKLTLGPTSVTVNSLEP
jgi:alpha-L-arabinofuranosidase